MSKNTTVRRLSESSSIDSDINMKLAPMEERKQRHTSHSSKSKKSKTQIAPVNPRSKLSARELFGTDSENEDEKTTQDMKREAVQDKKRPSSRPHHSSEPERKRNKHQEPTASSTKLSSRDVFGTDSDDDEIQDQASAAPLTSAPKDDNTELMKCKMCKILVPQYEYKYHLRTNLHKSNCLQCTEFDNIYIVETAFRNRIATYRLNSLQNCHLPEEFITNNQNSLIKLLNIALKTHVCIKVNFELFAYFMLPKSGMQQLKSFNTKYEIIYKNSNLRKVLSNLINIFKNKFEEFEQCESGWTFISMSHLEINVNKYCPMRGGTYMDLPLIVKKSRSCINVKNNDNHCFLWSIMAELFPAKCNVSRMSSYPHYSAILNTKGMSFPPSIRDIKLFEKLNTDISINIYGLDKKARITGPLYLTKQRRIDHINLLYIERDGIGHYCLIKDLVRLVRRQVTHYKGKVRLCERCLQFFNDEFKYRSHNCGAVLTILPNKNSILKFKNYERQQKINFIIYADFECLLINHSEKKSENTQLTKLHEPSCFGYYICCSHDTTLNKYVTYRGKDCVEVFVKRLIRDAARIQKILLKKKPMSILTHDQELQYQKATECHICKQLLFDDKVRDHDHITSEFRGASHSHCNLMYRVCPFIPVVIHNLAGYDSHLFINELAKYEGSIKIIPKSKESYLSISKVIEYKKGVRPIEIKFIDSYQFLNSSIDMLSKSLSDDDFIHLSHEFGNNCKLELLRKKGVYPYDYMDSWSKFDETQLPLKSCFYNTLNAEEISDEQFEFAKSVWNHFSIKTLGDYTDLYLKCDVLILCDIFEKFRSTSLFYYNLDPAYYITSPSLSWDAMLLLTKVELELISDIEIYQMLERGIRGGLAQCSLRHAMASNKYLGNSDKMKPSSYLIYLDCNNLYGYAMTRKYPISDFKFLSPHEIETFDVVNVSDDCEYGFILEVDLHYPDHLHDLHSDLPFAVEKFKPPGSKCEKLIANLYDKFNYVIHYVHLKECLKNGLQLMKIHKILSFRQENYLKKYIDLNTLLRQSSTTSFEKDFFKLLNNSIFGKTIENKRKQVDVKLATTWNDTRNITNKYLSAEKLITRPNLKNVTVFSENFVAIQLNHEKVILDRPIYIGFSVLEYAKQHMYKFHYDYIKRMYNDCAHLCYTDTDSLLYLIYSDDFYKDMSQNLHLFDTSGFTSDNIYNINRSNEKVPGLFKDEMNGDLIKEFIGLRAKLYCINSVKTQIKKAKGISKSVTKYLDMKNYSDALYEGKHSSLKCSSNLIKSIKHVLYTQEVKKEIFSKGDDKRQVLNDRIHTLPWGHCDTIF